MRWWERLFNRWHAESVHVVGRILDEPLTLLADGRRYMVFSLAEMPAREFRLRMFPTTPNRQRGDLVEVTFVPGPYPWVEADSVFAAPDVSIRRLRQREALTREPVTRGSRRRRPPVKAAPGRPTR